MEIEPSSNFASFWTQWHPVVGQNDVFENHSPGLRGLVYASGTHGAITLVNANGVTRGFRRVSYSYNERKDAWQINYTLIDDFDGDGKHFGVIDTWVETLRWLRSGAERDMEFGFFRNTQYPEPGSLDWVPSWVSDPIAYLTVRRQ